MIRFALTLVFAVSFTSCLTTQTIPTENFYRLSLTGNVETIGKSLLKSVIAVKRFGAEALYHERAMIYSKIETPLEMRQYYYHRWSDVPPTLLQNQLIEYLQKANLAQFIVPYGVGAPPDYVISGFIKRFDHIVEKNQSRVLVVLSLKLENAETGKILLVKDYDKTAYSPEPNVRFAAERFGEAVTDIFNEFTKDIAPILTP
jgi:ABC-type uncharacterized transport system auxiliary subunit